MKLTATQAIDRLTLGPTPQLNQAVHNAGVSDWISQQLHPGQEPDPLRQRLQSLDVLNLDPVELFRRYFIPFRRRKDPGVREQIRLNRRKLHLQASSARLWLATQSPWQLRELLVDFWFNHFNVFAQKGLCHLWIGSYDNTAIRAHVFSHFEDMLLATARHPAMLFYLDNWLNTDPGSPHARGRFKGFNENYARELMELHTVGLHYTQADVIGATHLLTGWGLQRRRGFYFDPDRHDFSAQSILGRRFAGGENAIEDFLRFLAAHPDTAQHLAYQMAQYFVADNPPSTLVRHMQSRYLATKGNLRAVTEAMIEHPAFVHAAARRDKFRTPYRYVLAVLRASGRPLQNCRPLVGTLYQLGQPLYGCVTPNGWASTQDEWLSADALTARLNFAVALGGGWLPVTENTDTMMAMAMPAARQEKHPRRSPPLDLATVLAALGPRIPARSVAVARLSAKPLQAAVLLGSPQMQYC